MPDPMFSRIDPALTLYPWPDFPETEISSGARGSNGHWLLEGFSANLRIGVWEAEANLGRWVNWPVHEFMVILEGEVVMVEHDCETVIRAGECFYIPKGRRCIWNQAGYARKIMVLFDDAPGLPGDGTDPIRKVDPALPLTPIAPPPAAILHTAPPIQHAGEVYRDPSGQFSIGIWQSTGYGRNSVSPARTEVMHLLEGRMTLTAPDGTAMSFGPGESLLVPQGAANAWDSVGAVRKVYCIHQPKA